MGCCSIVGITMLLLLILVRHIEMLDARQVPADELSSMRSAISMAGPAIDSAMTAVGRRRSIRAMVSYEDVKRTVPGGPDAQHHNEPPAFQ
ncbi:hypothetical protein ACLOJK_009389 [Asimina triloba]